METEEEPATHVSFLHKVTLWFTTVNEKPQQSSTERYFEASRYYQGFAQKRTSESFHLHSTGLHITC